MKKTVGIIFCAFILQYATPAHAVFAMAASMAYNALPFSPSFNFIAEAGQIIKNVQTTVNKVKTTIYQTKSAYTSLKTAATTTFKNIKSGAVLDIAGNPGQVENKFCGKKVTKVKVEKIAKKTKEILLTYDSLAIDDRNETDKQREKFYLDNLYAINAAAGQLQIKLEEEISEKIKMAKLCAEGKGGVCGIPSTDTGGNNEVLFTYGKSLETLDSVVKLWESVSALRARFTAVQVIYGLNPEVQTKADKDGDSDGGEEQASLIPFVGIKAVGKFHSTEELAFAQVVSAQADISLSDSGSSDSSGGLVEQTIEFVSPDEPENEHNLLDEEENLEALTELEPAKEAVEEAIAVHNMIGEMKNYKEAAEAYIRAQEEYAKYAEKLRLSESYGLRYVATYFTSSQETWSGISSWAKDAYEVAKAAQAASSVSDDWGELSLDEETMNDLNDDPDGSKAEAKFKDVKIEKSKSDQEKSEEENRKTALLAWQTGAEASKLLASGGSDWGTQTDKDLIWTDAKNFYKQYLTRKYDNIRKYLKSLSYNDVLAVVVERLKGKTQDPSDSKYQETLEKEGEAAAQEIAQYAEENQKTVDAFAAQKKSAVAALEAQRAQIVAEMDKINQEIKEKRDEIADIREVAKEKAFNDLEESLTAEVVFENPGSQAKGKELGMDGMKESFSEGNEKATDEAKIGQLNSEIDTLQPQLDTLEKRLEDLDDQIAEAKLNAQEGALSSLDGKGGFMEKLLENIQKKQQESLASYGEDVKTNMMAILEQLKESNKLLNVPVLWNKSVSEAQGLVAKFETQVDAIIDSALLEMALMKDDLYKPSSHQKLVQIHNNMLNKIKALTGTYSVAGLIKIDNLAVYAKLLAADTSPETEGLFVGATPKARDLKAPYAMPNFVLPPVREIFHFDETDFANVKPQQKKKRKKNRTITVQDFLDYGGEIPSVWKEMLKENAFIESSYDLKEALSIGCEDVAFSRGGIMPCAVDGGSIVLDVNKDGEYVRRSDIPASSLPRCLKMKMVKGAPRHTLMDTNVIIAAGGTEAVDCKYSELGMLFEAEGNNRLKFRERAFDAYEILNSDIDEDSNRKDKNKMASAQQASFDKNQIGDYLKHAENEKNSKENLETHKKTYEKQLETLKERLKQYGFEPSDDFDLTKESDYNLAVSKLKEFKAKEIQEVESVISSVKTSDNKPVKEKVDIFKKLTAIMKDDTDGLLQLDLTSADDNDLAAQLKKAKADEAAVDKYKSSLKEKQKDYNDTQEPFCANY